VIRVLVVDDLAVVRKFITYLLDSDPEIQVIGTAANGEEAVEEAKRKKPSVITMDIHMPKMDGFEATRRIMEVQPTPIVIVSGSSTVKEAATAFKAIEAGALAVAPRPEGIGHPEHEAKAKELIQTVKLMSEVKVVRRWLRPKREITPSVPQVGIEKTLTKIQMVAIGASTGGPIALQTVLSGLAKDFPVPVLIVQHIAVGFLEGLVDWLAQSTGFPVHIATDGEHPRPGHVYVAPDGFHMVMKAGNRIALTGEEPRDGLRPSVSHLFASVAKVFGKNAVGVLLTGMGKDGADELKRMKDRGAITIAQDEESSIVYGMPGEAVKLDAATFVLSIEKIPEVLEAMVKPTSPLMSTSIKNHL